VHSSSPQSFLAIQAFVPHFIRCLNVPKSFEAHRWNVRTFQNIAVHLHGARYPSAIRYPVCLADNGFSEAAWFDAQLPAQIDVHIGDDGRFGGVPVHKFQLRPIYIHE
jgi:hypothetical protein